MVIIGFSDRSALKVKAALEARAAEKRDLAKRVRYPVKLISDAERMDDVANRIHAARRRAFVNREPRVSVILTKGQAELVQPVIDSAIFSAPDGAHGGKVQRYSLLKRGQETRELLQSRKGEPA